MQRAGVTAGIGFPVGTTSSDRASLVNISLGYERTFFSQNKALTQDVLKLSLSFTFNETWFRKLKIY